MAPTQLLNRIGLLAVVILLATGITSNPLSAQDAAKPDARAEAAKKKKDAEKTNAAKQADTTQKSTGSAPMSGFRPDPQSNY